MCNSKHQQSKTPTFVLMSDPAQPVNCISTGTSAVVQLDMQTGTERVHQLVLCNENSPTFPNNLVLFQVRSFGNSLHCLLLNSY